MKKVKYLMTVALVCVLIVLIYNYFVNNKSDKDDSGSQSETISLSDKVLAIDLEGNYPLTPREVVQYFTNIQKSYYNEEHKEKQLVQLAYQAMKLFDEELVAENEFDEYYENLTLEVEEYKTAGRTITKVIIDKARDVVYSEIDGVKYAKMNCIYYVKEGGATIRVTAEFGLRCDDQGLWKILGYRKYTPSDYED